MDVLFEDEPLAESRKATPPARASRGIRLRPAWLAALCLLLTVFGIWTSLHFVYAAWGTDSDVADVVMLWRGVAQHGLSFLESWGYTQDNWLLSLLPIDFMVFRRVGTDPFLVLGIGWLIYAAGIGVLALIAWQAAGLAAAMVLVPVLLLANYNAIGGVGFLTYPVTHNISLLWGFLGVFGAVRFMATRRLGWVVGAGLCLWIGTLSDPWTEAAICLPLVVACLLTWILPGRPGVRQPLLGIALAVSIVLVLVHDHLFGAFGFLPGSEFDQAPWSELRENAHWLFRYLAVLFNIVPGVAETWNWQPSRLVTGIDLAAIAALLGFCAVLFLRHYRTLPVALRVVVLTAGASMGAVATALLLAEMPRTIETGRLLANWCFLLPATAVLVLAGCWGQLSRAGRLLPVLLAALYIVASVGTGAAAWLHARPRLKLLGVDQTMAFLRAHDLQYGYGGYWSVQANAVSWLSGGSILLRPVMFLRDGQRIVPRLEQASPGWYQATDVPTAQQRFFLMLAPDDDLCRDVQVCLAAAMRQFGPPAELLHDGAAVVGVWHHPMLAAAPPVAAALATPPAPIGQPVGFGADGTGNALLGIGWSLTEPHGVWSDGTTSVVLLHLPKGWQGPATIDVDASSAVLRWTEVQHVTLLAGDRVVAEWDIRGGVPAHYTATIPASALQDGAAVLQFRIPGAAAPRVVGMGDDPRQLGIFLRDIIVRPGG
jgi:hypothetical protein